MLKITKILKKYGNSLVISKEITIFVYPLKDGAEEHPARGVQD